MQAERAEDVAENETDSLGAVAPPAASPPLLSSFRTGPPQAGRSRNPPDASRLQRPLPVAP